jgi:tetratricopeptide (TPR) repeat protein
MRFVLIAALAALAAPAASTKAPDAPQWLLGDICHGEAPPRIDGPHRLVMLAGMGDDHMTADTRNPEAQRWFDYGLTLARSFEHGDAVLAFQRAEAADPACSLCVWGEAWSRGPTINFPADPGQIPAVLVLAKKAKGLAGPSASAPIRGLEAALVDRYAAATTNGGDLAFAHDIDALAKADPGDVEVAIFDAEAWLIMERHDDATAPARAVAVLKPLVPEHPDDSGLVHFYVHATEEAGTPELAAPYAGRLAELAPSASHMVHMPSHTWYRIGRYEDAAQANLAALRADAAYAQKTDFPTPLGRLTYHAHDIAFGLAGAMMAGDGPAALELVRQFNQDFPSPAAYDPRAEGGAAQTLMALGRFADPRTVLAMPDTAAAKPYLEALRHYARGEADLRLGDAVGARAEATLTTVPGALPGSNRAVVVEIARRVLAGEADMLDRSPGAAAAEFAAAADLQDTRLAKSVDPPAWWYPVRRSLAAALLAKGDAAGAERETAKVLLAWKLDPITLAIRAAAEQSLNQPAAARDRQDAQRLWHGDPASLRVAADSAGAAHG